MIGIRLKNRKCKIVLVTYFEYNKFFCLLVYQLKWHGILQNKSELPLHH